MTKLVLIAHNLRSAHNVGSLLRTADGLGVDCVYLTGYTPYPPLPTDDPRLPHLAQKLGRQIDKTALGAASSQVWEHRDDVFSLILELRQAGYAVAAVEQASDAIAMPDFRAPEQLALLVGREVEGVELEVLASTDIHLEIPMFGKKESFNVAQAAAMALYQCRFKAES